MKPAFRTFLSKSGLLHAHKALRSQGFFLIPFLWVKVKTLKMWNEYFYAKSLFEHSFTINSPSTPPQMPVGSCILRSDGDAAHYRIGHIAPRFCGSFALRCTPSSFLKEAKNASATALSWGRAVAEKDCFAPHFCNSSVSVAEVYCAPRSLWKVSPMGLPRAW